MTHPIRLLPVLFLLVIGMISPGWAEEKKTDPAAAKAHYEAADKALNAAWTAAKAALGDDGFAELKREQKAWLEYRDYIARSPQHAGVDHDGDLPLTAPEYLDGAAYLAEERTAWLKGLVRKWADNEDLTGEWSDSYGGSIRIVEQKGKLVFAIECVRGPTSHSGEIDGTAAWNRTIGWFSVKPEGKDGGETSLSFILRDRQLEIIGANTGHFHGMRAYFDGKYVKTRALTRKERDALLVGDTDEAGK